MNHVAIVFEASNLGQVCVCYSDCVILSLHSKHKHSKVYVLSAKRGIQFVIQIVILRGSILLLMQAVF